MALIPDTFAGIAQRHGFSTGAARAIADALRRGGGTMAQFNHPELGGMGQWVSGGMIMIGDMFNNHLKARVDALCRDIAASPEPVPAEGEQYSGQTGNWQTGNWQTGNWQTGNWWPDGLGNPSATGSQNEMRYACFPDARRLAVMRDGRVRVYDTGDHRIGGFSQQQSGSQNLTFTSQNGTVRLDDLTEV